MYFHTDLEAALKARDDRSQPGRVDVTRVSGGRRMASPYKFHIRVFSREQVAGGLLFYYTKNLHKM